MRPLYYIARAERLHRFDALFDAEGMLVTAFDADRLSSLTAFVQRDKAIVQQEFIVLDVGDGTQWSVPHVLAAVRDLRRFSNARPVFIGLACEANTELFGRLADAHGVKDLLVDRDGGALDDALAACFDARSTPRFAEKMQAVTQLLSQSASAAVRPLSIPAGLVLHIALAGTAPRCGTTTQAFAVYHYLRSLGLRPAILDERGTLIEQLMKYETYAKEASGAVTVRGVSLCSRRCGDFNAYVSDLGVLRAENAAGFCGADACILLGGAKPWELTYFGAALQLILPYAPDRLIALVGFTTEEELQKLGKYLCRKNGAAPCVPDLWRPSQDAAACYDRLLLGELKELCGAPHAERPAEGPEP